MDFTRLRVLDGGFGSELENAGFDINVCRSTIAFSPLLCTFRQMRYGVLEQSPTILHLCTKSTPSEKNKGVRVLLRFLNAGAEVILTNTYNANLEVIM